MEKRELDQLPDKINALESEQQTLFTTLSDPQFYKKGANEAAALKLRLETLESEIAAAYQRWESLAAVDLES